MNDDGRHARENSSQFLKIKMRRSHSWKGNTVIDAMLYVGVSIVLFIGLWVMSIGMVAS